MSWVLLPDDTAEVALEQPELTLRVDNFGATPLEIRPTSVGYLAGRRFVHAFPAVAVDGGAHAEITVSLELPDIDWSAVLSPANLFVLADAVGDSSRVRERAHSPIVFFHRDVALTRAYGERAMQDNHQRGDLKGNFPQLHDDAGLVAVIDATAGEQVAGIGDEEGSP